MIAVLQKGQGGGLGGGGGSGATPRADTASGLGMSAIRNMKASDSTSSLSSFAGGLATSFGVQAVSAAVSSVGGAVEDARNIAIRGRAAAMEAPLGAGPGGGASLRRASEQRGEVEWYDKHWQSLFGSAFEYGKGWTTRDKARKGNDQLMRFLDEKEGDRVDTGETAREKTLRQIAPLAATGVFNDDADPAQNEQAKGLTANLYRLNLKQAQGIKSAQRYVELIDSDLNAVGPGQQGYKGPR